MIPMKFLSSGMMIRKASLQTWQNKVGAHEKCKIYEVQACAAILPDPDIPNRFYDGFSVQWHGGKEPLYE